MSVERKWTILVCPACDVGPRMGMSHGACPECGRRGAPRTVEVVPESRLRGVVTAAAAARAAWQAFTEDRAEEADVDVAFDALAAALGGQAA
jgi:hypothetical protein